MRTLSHDSPALRSLSLALVVLVSLAACAKEREPAVGEGIHPLGWSEKANPAHHAAWLRANGDDLTRCRACHGDDYRGGPVGVTCSKSTCHEAEKGPEACGTCHGPRDPNDPHALGDPDNPRPETGAHLGHERFCGECHVVPENVGDPGHIGDESEGPDITFSGLALANDSTPTFEADPDKRCAGVYCHVAGTPEWDQEEELDCNSCHVAPPDSHARFASIAQPPDDCKNCHADPAGDTHVDGTVELELPEGCGTCHGDDDTGAPPAALSHRDDDPAIGAHQRHLDANLPDRVAPAVACASCHVVPTEDDVLADGHIDDEAPADVVLVDDGTYDYDDRTCEVWCHYNQDPQALRPAWGDPSNQPSECNACHEAPPASHERFARIASDDESCGICHPAPPADTHVNHELDLDLPAGCGTCHGSNDEGYPPVALDGATTPTNRGVGAHATHLDPSPALYPRISAPVACSSCHPVDRLDPEAYLFDPGHIDDDSPADVVLFDGGSYNAVTQKCTTSCHWDRIDGPFWTDVSVDLGAGVSDGWGPWRQCGSCHSMPPVVSRDGDAHPASGPDLADCVGCHVSYSAATHINGEVDF